MQTKALRQALDRLRSRCTSAGSRYHFDHLVRAPHIQQMLEEWASGQGDPRGDAANLPYAARQLEYVFTETVKQEYPNQVFANRSDPLVAWGTEVPKGAKTFTYYLQNTTTTAVFLGTLANGALPRPSLRGSGVTGQVEPFGNEYAWTLLEMWSAAFVGQPLERDLAEAAQDAHVELLNTTAAYGREDIGLPGFLDHPNIAVTPAADGAFVGANPSWWINKTPPEIRADVLSLVRGIANDSRRLYQPNVVAMPGLYLDILNDTMLSETDVGGNQVTIMESLMKALNRDGRTVRFRECEDLLADNSFGHLDGDSIIAFNDDPKFVTLEVPGGVFFEQQPMEQSRLEFVVPAISLIGGIRLPHPQSVGRLDNIGAFVPA